MIFADKLVLLRKKNGWSQEELANQMHVSRQSVSKWEGAQSVPDLEKIVQLSRLFDVSIDYLLKEEIEVSESDLYEQSNRVSEAEPDQLRRVSMEEASAFLEAKEQTAAPIASGVLLCILSPICLLVLSVASENPSSGVKENMAAGLGVIVLLAMVAIAVTIFIYCGSKTSAYVYLEEEIFETEYGVTGMVKERKEQYKSYYTLHNMIGVGLCILAAVPLFVGIIINEENELLLVSMLSFTLLLVGIGVYLFIRVGIVWASFEKLLQEGDYTRKQKRKAPLKNAIGGAYWMIVTAIYLGYSLVSNRWESSWIIWVVAGVAYPALLGMIQARELHRKRDKQDEMP